MPLYKSFEHSDVMNAVKEDKQWIEQIKAQCANALIGCEIFAAHDFNVAYAFNNRDGEFYKITANADGFNVSLLEGRSAVEEIDIDKLKEEADAEHRIDTDFDADADNLEVIDF